MMLDYVKDKRMDVHRTVPIQVSRCYGQHLYFSLIFKFIMQMSQRTEANVIAYNHCLIHLYTVTQYNIFTVSYFYKVGCLLASWIKFFLL